MVIISAGLFIVHKNESVLLVHPTGANWKDSFQIPKGIAETEEDLIDTAIRETKEEIGITIHRDMITDKTPKIILYKNKDDKIYKKVYYFVIRLNSESKYEVNQNILQKEEIDWAGFVPYEEAKKKIFWRFKSALNDIFKE